MNLNIEAPFFIIQIWKIKFFTIPGLAELFNLKNENHESWHLAHSPAKANKKDSIKLKTLTRAVTRRK